MRLQAIALVAIAAVVAEGCTGAECITDHPFGAGWFRTEPALNVSGFAATDCTATLSSTHASAIYFFPALPPDERPTNDVRVPDDHACTPPGAGVSPVVDCEIIQGPPADPKECKRVDGCITLSFAVTPAADRMAAYLGLSRVSAPYDIEVSCGGTTVIREHHDAVGTFCAL